MILIVLCATTLAGQQRPADSTDVISQLLERPAPPPRWQSSSGTGESQQTPVTSPTPFVPPAPPPDDASLEALVGFWSASGIDRHLKPSDKVRDRLLEGCEKHPEYLPSLLDQFRDTPETHTSLKKLLDAEGAAPKFSKEWRQKVHDWLMRHTKYLRGELIEAARSTRDNEDSGDVSGDENLRALAALDWTAAQPLLNDLVAGHELRTAALALSLLYDHAVGTEDEQQAEALRTNLKRLAADRQAPGRVRNMAVEALTTSEWSGRDEWYLSLFGDETLRSLHDGYYLLEPLTTPVDKDPDKWIPIVSKLIGNKNRAIHDAAVTCLIRFQLTGARKDALSMLLPWLSDPTWSSARDRLRLIQSLDRLDLPECVPGLIWVVEHDDDLYNRSYAAESLIPYHDSRAVPALKKALDRESNEVDRRRIIAALIACDGLTDDDAVRAVEAYAAQIATPEGFETFRKQFYELGSKNSLPSLVSLGSYLSERWSPRHEVAVRLLARANVLQATRPDVARSLLVIVQRWPDKSVDLDLVKRIEAGKADAEAISSGLERRQTLQESVGSELRALLRKQGSARGVAAVILDDSVAADEILGGSDIEAQRALLACARLVRNPLPVAGVGRLLKQTAPGLSLAAQRYLESEDSAEARDVILKLYPGQARILGARSEFDPGHDTFGPLDDWEQQLREMVLREQGPQEVFALLSAGYWGSAGQRVILLRNGIAELRAYDSSERYYSRRLGTDELEELRNLIAEKAVDDLPPLAHSGISDGMQFEYIHLTRDGGRRVFMNNPGMGRTDASPYASITGHFRRLTNMGEMPVHYTNGARINGFQVLLADDQNEVWSVWKLGNDMRVLVKQGEDSAPAWRSFDAGKLLGVSQPPPDFNIPGDRDDVPEKMEVQDHLNRYNWQVQSGESFIRAGTWKGQDGLWKSRKGKQPIKVADGNCGWPIVTPDGRWLVAAKTDGSWAEPNFIIRVDLTTGRQFRVNVAIADTLQPVAYVPAREKVLLYRVRDNDSRDKQGTGPAEPEYLLLDPASGATEVVSGDFWPWFDQTYRPLQPTGRPNEVWAALYDHPTNTTNVGRYDTKTFKFTKDASIATLRFDSMAMWVVASENQIYVAYHPHLLSVKLR